MLVRYAWVDLDDGLVSLVGELVEWCICEDSYRLEITHSRVTE